MNEADRFLQEQLNKGDDAQPRASPGQFAVPPARRQPPPTAMQRKVTLAEAWKSFWTRWTFKGRSSRSEFWYMQLIFLGIDFIFGFLGVFPKTGPFAQVVLALWGFAAFIPWICLCVRRLHDIGRTAWELLLVSLIPFGGFLVLYWMICKPSEPIENEYGPVPNTAG